MSYSKLFKTVLDQIKVLYPFILPLLGKPFPSASLRCKRKVKKETKIREAILFFKICPEEEVLLLVSSSKS